MENTEYIESHIYTQMMRLDKMQRGKNKKRERMGENEEITKASQAIEKIY